jgi:hypothetical protein
MNEANAEAEALFWDRDVRFWHKADIAERATNVRF